MRNERNLPQRATDGWLCEIGKREAAELIAILVASARTARSR